MIPIEDFTGPTRMDISSNLTNQCSGCNQSQNIELANKSTKQSPQEGRHKFNVETLSREKNHDLEIKILRTVTGYTHSSFTSVYTSI